MFNPDTSWLLALILYPLALLIFAALILRSIVKLISRRTPSTKSSILKLASGFIILGFLTFFYYLFVSSNDKKYISFVVACIFFAMGVVFTFMIFPPFQKNPRKS